MSAAQAAGPRHLALADKQDCVELVLRVARALDRCDAELLASLYHDDATDDHGLFQGSAGDFVAWVIPMLQTMMATQHCISQTLIELAGDAAFGESYFTAYHTIPGPDGAMFMVVGGRYLDRFERRGGLWKISHRQAVYDWSSNGPSTDSWDRASPGSTSFGVRGSLDPSSAYMTGRPA